MPDLIITPDDVQPKAGGQSGTAGVAIAAGKVVHVRDHSGGDGLVYLGDASAIDSTNFAHRGTFIALNSAAVGQPVNFATGGEVTLGAAVTTAAAIYATSAAAPGGIAPIADIVPTNAMTVLGYGSADGSGIVLSPIVTNLAVP